MAGIAPQDDQADPNQATDQSAPDQSQGPDEVGDEEGMAPNVSPEEQQQYEEFVLSAMALIYQKAPGPQQSQPQPGQDDGDGADAEGQADQGADQEGGAGDAAPDAGEQQGAQVRPGILKLLDNDPSDLRGVLKAQELKQFSPLVAIAATAVIITVEIQRIAKGTPDEPTDDIVMHGAAAIIEELAEIWMRRNKQQLGEDDVHRALSMAADIYREVAADQGLIDENALKDQFAMLVKADKEGKLAEVSPDLAGINKAAEINATQGEDVPSPDQQPPDGQQEEQPQ